MITNNVHFTLISSACVAVVNIGNFCGRTRTAPTRTALAGDAVAVDNVLAGNKLASYVELDKSFFSAHKNEDYPDKIC